MINQGDAKNTKSKSLVIMIILRHTGWTRLTGWTAPGRKLESWSLVARPFLVSCSSSSLLSAYDLFVAAATDHHSNFDRHVDQLLILVIIVSSDLYEFHPFLHNVSTP